MKKITLLIAFMLASIVGYGQVSSYSFSQSTGNTYTEITGGTVLATCTNCTSTSHDGTSWVITLPTPVLFNGVMVSSVVMRADGSLIMGSTTTSASTEPISATTTATGGIISPLGADLRTAVGVGIVYETRWEELADAYVFQWKNASRWASQADDRLNFQVRINKTTGVITMAYGSMTVGTNTSYQPQVGLRGITNADFINRRLTDAVPDASPSWDDTVAGTSNSNTVRLTNTAPAAFPATGLNYVWTPPTCYVPTVPTISNVTATSATAQFTAPNIAPSNGYEYYLATTNTAPVAGTTPTGTVSSGTTINLINLSPVTTYYIFVRSNCGSSNSIWTAVRSFTTFQSPSTIPFTEGFEGANNWSIVNGTETNKWFIGNVVNNGGANALYVSNNASGTNNDYTHTTSTVHAYRDINVPAGTTEVVVSFDWKGGGENGYDYIRVAAVPLTYVPVAGTQITAANSGGVVVIDNIQGSAAFTTYAGAFNATQFAGQTVRLVFSWRNDFGGGVQPAGAVDNINVIIPTCFVPSGLQATNALGSATISWTAPATLPANGYDIYFSNVNILPLASTAPTHTSTTTSVTVNDLTGDGVYYYWVRSNCGGGDSSVWVPGGSFMLDCAAVTPPTALETFTDYGTTMPAPGCWREATGALTATPVALTGTSSGWTGENFNNSAASENGKAARVELYGTRNEWIISPAIDLGTGAVEYQLEYTASVIPWSGTATVTNMGEKYVKVVISTDGGLTWSDANVVKTYNQSNIPSTPVSEYISLAGYTGTVKIGFYGYSTTTAQDLRFYIDNFRVIETPDCLIPLTPAVNMASIGEVNGTVTWAAPAVAPANGYQYYVSTVNTDPTGATTPTGSVGAGIVSANITSLTPSTKYYVWVRSNCGSGSYSEWAGPVNFKTNCDAFDITTATATPVCGQGASTLTATATGGTIKWFSSATETTALATGATYTTPVINTTTSYWVSTSQVGTQTESSGRPAPEASATTFSSTGYGIVFNTGSEVLLQNVSVYTTNDGTINIQIVNSAGVQLYETGNVNVTAGGTTTPNIIPLNFTVPAGNNYRMLIKAYSTGLSLVRDSSGNVFPYNGSDEILNVTSGYTGSTSTSYYYFYDLKYLSVCTSARTEVVATVTPAPAIDATVSDATICAGESTNLNVTSDNAGYSYLWMPGNLDGAAQTVNPAETTTYTVTATDAVTGCVIIDEVTVTVNPLPSAIVVEDATVCLNEIVTLTATGGNFINSGKIGSGTATNTLSTPFKGHWGGSKTQAIYTAAELTALGMAAGDPITSIGYVVLSGTPVPFNNFTINIGLTSETSITTFSSAATTQIFTSASYTATGVPGTLTFNIPAPILWDGVSNLLVETCFNNVNAGSGTVSNLSVESTTVASGLNIYLSQDNNATVCTNTNAPSTTTNRPNLVVGYAKQGSVSWSPATNLYTDAAATTPYVAGTNSSVLYFKSSTAGVSSYSVASTLATGCSVSETFDVNVISTPAPVAADVALCNGATVANLAASVTGDNLQWYSTETGGTALASTDVLISGTYYVSQTQNGCEGPRASHVVTINTTDAPATTDLTFCNEAPTVADLEDSAATGNNLQWYNVAQGGTALANTELLVSGTYYVTETANGCESTRASFSVTVNTVNAPAAPAAQTLCAGSTVADIEVTGTATQWYSTATGDTPVAATTVLANGDTYYVSQIVDGCESERTTVAITINTVDAPTGEAIQSVTAGTAPEATIEDLEITATGTVTWYASEEDALAGTNPLAPGTEISSGTYYAVQTIDGCTSVPFEVTVTVTLDRNSFALENVKIYPNPVVDKLVITYSSDITLVEVYNILGQRVIVEQPNAATATINMSNLETATYIVKVTADGMTKDVKVVKRN